MQGDTWLLDDYAVANVQWQPCIRADISGPHAVEEGLAQSRLVEAARALEPLVDEWQTLVQAGRWERFPGQLARVLSDLGALPPADDGVYVMWTNTHRRRESVCVREGGKEGGRKRERER